MGIANECLAQLDSAGLLAGRRVADVVLTDYYVGVALDDGHTGWALSYAQPSPDHVSRERGYLASERDDRLWTTAWFRAPALTLETRALRAALLAALSVPVFDAPERHGLRVHDDLPPELIAGSRCAAVIGFGGLMWRLLGAPMLEQLHILDHALSQRRDEMEAILDAMRLARPELSIVISDGHDWPATLRGSDTVAITGSTLCNGSLDTILAATRPEQRVIVQGQSIAIHPAPLFARGVAAVMTTRKPAHLFELARADRSGAQLRPWFEGGNEAVCLLPSRAPVATDRESPP